LVVVIDVFRAFSTACYLFAAGTEKIIAVGDVEVAYELQQKNPSYILVGEREGRILPGFDFGNSPSRIKDIDFTVKTVVLTTSAGTQGIIKASNAEEIITASFVNSGAVVKYITEVAPEKLSLVAMGIGGQKSAPEDVFCAQYIKNSLQGQKQTPPFSEIISRLKQSSGQRFFDENLDWSPEKDFQLCLVRDKFDFVLQASPVDYNQEMAFLKKQEV
ncbi:MAG: 2-phosphosulfolactate phosphatase, partial [bacterium]